MRGSEIATGTCDGTGAAINVCLGFTPEYVKVWNVEDAGSKLPVLEWMRAMAVFSALDEGVKDTGLDDTDYDRTVMAADGIAAYDGGDELTYDGVTDSRWEDSSGNNAEEVYVDGHYKRDAAGDAAYKCIGDSQIGSSSPRDGAKCTTPPGFTIGADADINVNGEQLIWLAIR